MKTHAIYTAVVLLGLGVAGMAQAVPALPGTVQLKNKTGGEFAGRLKGDEWFNWAETAAGYVAVKNPKTGDFEFARLSDGALTPSGIKVGAGAASASATGLLQASDAAFRALVAAQAQNGQARAAAARGATSFSPASASATSISSATAISGVTPPPGKGRDHGPASVWNSLKTPPTSVPLLVIILEFNDQQLRSPVSTWAAKIFGNEPGQMNYYWNTVSNGRFHFTPAHETEGAVGDGIMRVKLAMNHPNLGTSTGTTERYAALDQLDGFINFADYDTNHDGRLNKEELAVIYIYAGGESATGSTLPSVWAHMTSDSGIYRDGVGLGSYARFGERHHSAPNDYDATIGTIAHELGHAAFNLPDLYDNNGAYGGVDDFCLMGGGAWGAPPYVMGEGSPLPPGSWPVAPSAWVRYRLGFTDTAIVTPGTPLSQTLKPQSRQGLITLVPTANEQEYFLVENRYPDGTDIGLKGRYPQPDSGAVIWHIDETQHTNTNNARRLAAYESKDDTQYFWPAPGMTVFDGNSTPNSRDNAGVATGVKISNLTAVGDADHSVSFTAEKLVPTKYPTMFFRGTPNNWGSTAMTAVAPGVWESAQTFASGVANARFKFDVKGDWTLNFGDTNKDGILEQGGGDIPVATPGSYLVRFYESTMRYELGKANLPPVANAGPDRTVFVNEDVLLDGRASSDPDGSIASYKWDNGLSGAQVTTVFGSPGTNILTLTVTDNLGASASDSVIFTVKSMSDNLPPTAKIAPVGPVVVGQTVMFDGSGSSDPEGRLRDYSWVISGQSVSLSGVKPSYAFTTAGTYTVSLVVTDNLGVRSSQATATVTVSPAVFKKTYNQVYYRGTSNNWAADSKMTLVGDNLWSITVNVPATGAQSFKFDINGDWALNFGDNNADGLADQNGGNIAFPAGGGSFVVTFNDSTRRYVVTKR